VSYVAIGVSKLPAWEGVGGKALVDETEGAGDERIRKFKVELLDLRGEHQSFVDDGATGERRNVEELLLLDLGRGDFIFSAAANQIKTALEIIFGHALGAADKELLYIWLRSAGLAADGITVDRCVAPAQDFEAFSGGNPLKNAFALEAAVLVHREEDHCHAVLAGAGKLNAKFAAFAGEENVRNLDENAGAIARLGIATRRSAMSEVNENLEPFADDVVAFFAADAGHKAHAARIVLILRVIETLRIRETMTVIRCLHWYLLLWNKVVLQSSCGETAKTQSARRHQMGTAG